MGGSGGGGPDIVIVQPITLGQFSLWGFLLVD
jgi:hypothetical protein